jgi:hypothetical protein
MKKLIDWPAIRLVFEIEAVTISEISRRFNVSRRSIYVRIRAEHWQRSFRRSVAAAAYRKVAQQGYRGRTLAEVSALVEREAERIAQVIRQHRVDWEDIAWLEGEARRLHDAADPAAAKAAELARLLGRTMMVIQDSERRVYGLDGDQPEEISDSELDEAIAEAVEH